ncbi:MAG: hypothetical protein KAY37_14395 [Phycisphaerae bacterium]|nr:hypothetical protein [Phycisphaerae bacterium]
MKRIVGLLAIMALVAPATLADDLYPPPWDRYGPTSTYAHWKFDSEPDDPLNIAPEEGYNPFGVCLIEVPAAGIYDEWWNTYQGRQGVWYIDYYDWMQIRCDNYPEPQPLKIIYLQITWWPEDNGDRPRPKVWGVPPEVGNFDLVHEEQLADGWMYGRWYQTIEPNPDHEWIDIWSEGGGSTDYLYIDQIVIDTICLGVCPGDSNCDNEISWRDIDFFVAAMNDNVAAWEAMFLPGTPSCSFANNDVNGDGTVNWRDIDPFVALMNTTCP